MKTNWQAAKKIFAEAIHLDAAARETFLEQACKNDAELHGEVVALLSSHNEADGFMEIPAISELAEIFAPPKQFKQGTKFGHYEIIDLIGSGGMGEVYLARDNRLNRNIALKLLALDSNDHTGRIKRFQLEAQTISALNHPNILTIHDFWEHGAENFLVTEFVEGETLRERTKLHTFSVDETLDIARQVASALSSAHGAGVVHRDIKPENIMLRPDGVIKILDFGIAKLVEDEAHFLQGTRDTSGRAKTAPGTILGTVNYMSPEQARGNEVDSRSDIFSLGVVLYEMLTGRPPFDDESTIDTISSILHKDPTPISEYVPEISPDFEEIVSKMIAKDYRERYQSAEQILHDLRAFQLERMQSHEGVLPASTTTSRLLSATTSGNEYHSNQTSNLLNLVLKLRTRKYSVGSILLIIILLTIGFGFRNSSVNGGTANIASIAVMPMVNLSGDPEMDYISDGITEKLIADLSQLPNLKVKARSSVFRFKGQNADARTIGRELGAQAILNGRVLRSGDELSISIELIDTETESIQWSGNYRRNSAELVALHGEISRDVSRRLQANISRQDGEKIAKFPTSSSEAYQHYLKGRFLWNKRTGSALKLAIPEFMQAVEKDPNFALAYVGLADSYALLEQYVGTPSNETLPKAKSYAARALEIDDSLAEAHTSMGFILYAMWQWDEADRAFKRAISLKPSYSTAHHWYYVFLRDTGRLSDALAEIKIAKDLDPLSLVINVSYSRAHLLVGDVDSSIELTKQLIELYPNYAPNYGTLGFALIEQGRYVEALEHIDKAVQLDRSGFSLSLLGYVNGVMGRKREANATLAELKAKHAKNEALGREVAAVYIGIGKRDEAFEWLEKDFVARSSELSSIVAMTEFNTVREDHRFIDLIRRMNLGS